MRELGLARLAERRPEIEQDDALAQVIAQPKGLPVDVARGEVRRDRAGPRRPHRGTRAPQAPRAPRPSEPASWVAAYGGDRVAGAGWESGQAGLQVGVEGARPARDFMENLHGPRIDIAVPGDCRR